MEEEESKNPTQVEKPNEAQPEENKEPEDVPVDHGIKHNGFKTSSLPQPEELKKYLQTLLISDPYNKFCIDCHVNMSSHACLAYGTFVCT